VMTGMARSRRFRVGVLWRGRNDASAPPEDRGLGPLFDAFGAIPVDVVPVPYSDERLEEARAQLSGLDGVLVWVNPIQDGADRRHLDNLLREVAATGIWVSAHPDVILKIGTKEVLYETRHLGWGSDTGLYKTPDELAERLPDRLAKLGRLVLKQGRGNGGNGVWSVEVAEPRTLVDLDSLVVVREARAGDDGESVRLGEYLSRCRSYFSWSGVLVDQEFQPRLAEGVIRCYFSHDEVVGFCHQWPKGLMPVETEAPNPSRGPVVMEDRQTAAYQHLRQQAESQWVPEMMRILGLDRRALPVIWDADFFYGPKDGGGRDTYVLCEINASAVWPFPPMASETIAANTVARITEAL
jgi:hypothetical protein